MLRTPWGYQVDADGIPPLIGVAEYATMTGATFEDTSRVEAVLAAASAAVRGFCGWHVAPVLTCVARVTGDGRMLSLPTVALEGVTSIEIDGGSVSTDLVEWLDGGLVRLRCGHWPRTWGGVTVTYEAGVDLSQCPDLAAVVAQIAANAMAGAPGVQSERAGEVSITYNATSYGVAGGVTLLARDRALLEPWRLPPVPR